MKRIGIALLALMLAGCGTPESKCRDGVAKMSEKMVKLLGSELRNDPDVVAAQGKVDLAQAQLATGNYDACAASLAEAGVALNRSQRTNQQ
jgi:hypothetical protein